MLGIEAMSFIYERIIRVQDTDATGVLYFANQLQISLEAFEEFMRMSGFSLTQMVEQKNFLLPIVHSEADYFLPITIGERVEVALNFTRIGTTSFTYSTELKREGELIGTASIVHVVYCPKKKQSQPIPEKLKSIIYKGEEK